MVALATLFVVTRIPLGDTLVYRAEGQAVVNGTSLYDFVTTEWKLPATYPPFAAILFVPTTWLPVTAMKVCFFIGNLALLALLVRLSWRFAKLPKRPELVTAATAFAIWLEPVFQTFVYGQINLVLACLVLWDLTRPQGSLGKGVALGIAAGIKLTPAIFIVYLLITGKVRNGLTALASFVATVLFGILVLPSASLDFWTRRMFETDRVGKVWIVDNQSLQGLLARAMNSMEPGLVWFACAVVVGLAGLWVARRAVRAGQEEWGIVAVALTMLLVSPISWSHHWVWCVPLLALLLAEGRYRLSIVLAVLFTARSFWAFPHQGDTDIAYGLWAQPALSPYPLLGLALLGWLAWRLRAAKATPVSASAT
ncbi:glycosyltransferase 87 family protein [Streptomyces sp. NBC_00237]|uniref:glycosyltransferase 87 family protein n=1 Tax=Streptomyces sp. NBC_00237 TaxID=2975687 RepID=UPI00224CF1E5|nr:glycosyltransferase 87 family protein [Streptomyces sp. NBC_00237]MCX5200459.1 glycosyltransferase 87 family protein [Streptomyces sp. NBC_00237]